jgi:rubrerythrin
MEQKSIFQAREILDMAVQIERQGVAFYQACRQSAVGEKAEDVFRFMIGQEKAHMDVFSSMKAGLQAALLPEEYPGERQSYLKSFVKNEVFYAPQQAARKAAQMEDLDKAVDFAVDLEKRSIRFYSGLKSMVRRSERAKIDEVIAQEHGHIRRLRELRQNPEKNEGQ